MATLVRIYRKPRALRLTLSKKVEETIEMLLPRRCMVVSTSLVLAGMGIPFLMVIGLLPLNLLLGFIGFILTATGCVLALTLCGEI